MSLLITRGRLNFVFDRFSGFLSIDIHWKASKDFHSLMVIVVKPFVNLQQKNQKKKCVTEPFFHHKFNESIYLKVLFELSY